MNNVDWRFAEKCCDSSRFWHLYSEHFMQYLSIQNMRVVGKLLPILHVQHVKINQSSIFIDQNVNVNSTNFPYAVYWED